MKNSKLAQILLILTLSAIGAVSCTPSGNTNTTTTVTATPAPTPDTNAIVAEITKIENDFPRIIREKDGAAVRRVEADDVVIVYPDGSPGNKEQDIKDIEAGTITFDAWDISDMKVHVINNDTAVATFLITVTNGKIKAPDGRTQDISSTVCAANGKYRVIDTFARRNAQWQLVASGVTPLSKAAAEAAAASASPKASPGATASPATKASPAPKEAPTRRPPPPPASTP
ncbi:MAG TPA: nuclear transport factor 2 family protein [Pyrinomonadaceae bacterium]